MSTTSPQDHVALAKDRLIYQFRDKPVINGLITSWMEELNNVEDVLNEILVQRDVDVASGENLDRIGRLFGIPRILEQSDPCGLPIVSPQPISDEEYKNYIRAKISALNVYPNPDNLINHIKQFFGVDNAYLALSAANCTVSIDTPLTQNQRYMIRNYNLIPKVRGLGFGFGGEFDSNRNFLAFEGFPGSYPLAETPSDVNGGKLSPGATDSLCFSRDVFFSDVYLLLHFDGYNGATGTDKIIDTSLSAHVPSSAGSSLTSAQSKFGITSYLVQDTVDISYTDDQDVAITTQDFCIEFSVYVTDFNAGHNPTIITNTVGDPLATGYAIDILPGASTYSCRVRSSGGHTLSSGDLPEAQWVHIAYTRESGTQRLFMNGILQQEQVATAEDLSGTVFDIGGGSISAEQCYLDEFRITLNEARYTENFNVPDEPFYEYFNPIPPQFNMQAGEPSAQCGNLYAMCGD